MSLVPLYDINNAAMRSPTGQATADHLFDIELEPIVDLGDDAAANGVRACSIPRLACMRLFNADMSRASLASPSNVHA